MSWRGDVTLPGARSGGGVPHHGSEERESSLADPNGGPAATEVLYCIAGIDLCPSSHKTIMLKMYIILVKLFETLIHAWIPCVRYNEQTGLIWIWVDHLTLSLFPIIGVWWESPPPLSFLAMFSILKLSLEEQFVSTLNCCRMGLWQWVGSHPSSSTATSPFPQLHLWEIVSMLLF
jgi:hypothetical protein